MARRRGYRVVAPGEPTDIHVVNGCTVTHEADADSRQAVRRAHATQPHARIVVTGCYAQSAPEEAAGLPGVTHVVGNGAKDELVALMERPPPAMAPLVTLKSLRERARARAPVPTRIDRSRAYLKIQDGCDYRCAFCIVPAVRGPSRSLPLETLRHQLRTLVEEGVAEVVLTGVHLGTYGRDLTPRQNLVDLVRALLPELRATRLRLGSLDPHEVTPDLIGLLAENPDQLCPHLHLPVQSGDNAVLRRMRRAHTVEHFQAAVGEALRRIPRLAVGCDVIVGFPGEDDAAFERTYNQLAAVSLAYQHVFTYSARQGTVAATWTDPVAVDIKKHRNRTLRTLARQQQRSFAERFVGHNLPVVFMRKPHRKTGALVGITDNYLRVFCDGPAELCGQMKSVRIQAVHPEGLRGTLHR